MSSFGLYLIGFIVLSIGIMFGAAILGVSNQWLAAIGLVLLGIGVITGVSKTRRRDPGEPTETHTETVVER